MTLSDIAKVFNKNHATVLHSLKQLPFLLKFDKTLASKHNNVMYMWLGNVDNSVEVSDQELKTRIRYLINQNKMLNSVTLYADDEFKQDFSTKTKGSNSTPGAT